jgi:RES domain-containing protein
VANSAAADRAAAKLPPPSRPLPALRPGDVRTLRTGTTLYRIYRTGGRNPSGWNAFRAFGPTSARFDPQVGPARPQNRHVLYAGGSIPTAVAEYFGTTRVVELTRDRPYLAGFRLERATRLLDMASDWPTRAGASQAISSGPKDVTRLWAQAIFEDYELDGIWYPSSMTGTTRRSGDPPLHGYAAALFTRARTSLPRRPVLNIPLDHPAVVPALAVLAERFGYGFLP